MLTDEQLQALPDPVQGHFRRLERQVVRTIAGHLRHIGRTGGRVGHIHMYRLGELQRMGFNLEEIGRQAAAAVNRSEAEVRAILLAASRAEYYGVRAHSRVYLGLAGRQALPPHSRNRALNSLVSRLGASTAGTFRNFSDTSMVAMVDRHGNRLPLPRYYREQIDFAIVQAAAGQDDWNRVMARTVRNMADGGLRRVAWGTGVTARLDTAARRNILWGLGELNRQQAETIAAEIGADGMETTWHDGYRPTHGWGGRQFPMGEYFARIRPQLEEPNCYHRAFPIILGVSTPAYTEGELLRLREGNEKEFGFGGETFTKYTASQRQREMEVAIRKAQDRVNAFGASGHEAEAKQERARLNQLFGRYEKFSVGIGDRPRFNRIMVGPYAVNK